MIGLVAGDFGRLHDGHLDHIIKASMICDFLYVVTHTDESIEQRKGYKPIPLWARLWYLTGILRLLRKDGEVLLSYDHDGTIANTLRVIRPDRLIKGGDRTPDNMPAAELTVCRELGIEIVYGIGDQLNESRKL